MANQTLVQKGKRIPKVCCHFHYLKILFFRWHRGNTWIILSAVRRAHFYIQLLTITKELEHVDKEDAIHTHTHTQRNIIQPRERRKCSHL